MASNWAGLTAVLAASNLALAVAKPIAPRDGLSPKVEIDYANITGRINGNIKEFLGVFYLPTIARKSIYLEVRLTFTRHPLRLGWSFRALTALH